MKATFRITILAAFLASLTPIIACNNQSKQPTIDSKNTATNNDAIMEKDKLIIFGKKYTQAWCSQTPGNVAAHFAEDGSLTVNNGTPAVGRIAIAKVAESFMTAFPDMVLTMDSLITNEKGIEYHWTLNGTNTGPGGTGKKVRISGVEIWQFDNQGLIKESKGSFDEEEYNRQLKDGMKN